MKHLFLLIFVSAMVAEKAFSQHSIPVDQAAAHIGETVSIYGTLFYVKTEPDKTNPDSFDVIMNMVGNDIANRDFTVIIRMKKGDSIRLFNHNMDFKNKDRTKDSRIKTVDGGDYKINGKIFIYEGKPAVKIGKDGLALVEIFEETDLSAVRNDTNRVYTMVDTPPRFPGGMTAFFDYLKRELRYPVVDKKNKIAGKVFVQFVVEKNGSLNDIKATRGPSKTLMKEAERVMQNCPRWIYGTEKGKPVRVAYTVPVDFSSIP